MTILDFVITPFYMIFFILIAKYMIAKNMEGTLKKYFLNGLYIKLLSSFATGLIYWYYYGDGDTIYYFQRIGLIHKAFGFRFSTGMKLLFNDPKIYDPVTYDWFIGLKARDASNLLIVKLGFYTSLISFKLYSVIALFFSVFAYSGVWRLFLLFTRKYPEIPKKYLAFTTLYLPSVFFWGSGLFKDTLTLGALCWVVVIINDTFVRKKINVFKILFLIACIYLIGIIKSYILMALLPALLAWGYRAIKLKMKSRIARAMATPILIGMIFIGGIFMLQQLATVFSKFSIDNIQDKAEDMQRWHTVRGHQKGKSSTYSLGEISFTPVGILKKIPAAVNVAIFRPYLWEVSNPVMLLASIESQLFLLIFLRFGLLRLGQFRRTISNDSFLTFSLIFTLIFAFSVGFTSFNFGALVRYKVPFLPFLALILVVLYNNYKVEEAKKAALKIVKEIPEAEIGNERIGGIEPSVS